MRTLKSQNMTQCRDCHSITDEPGEKCAICGGHTGSRIPDGLQRVWAFWIAGLLVYIPGNIYPITVTQSINGESPATIMGNVAMLLHHKSPLVAFVIFSFSVIIPVAKFIAIAWLAISIQKGVPDNQHKRLLVYEVVEFVGRWSMVDVFVVAVLAALIQVGDVLTIYPGVGILFFGISVILTMFSALNLDPRLIWENPEQETYVHDR